MTELGIVHRDLKPSNLLIGSSSFHPSPLVLLPFANLLHRRLSDHENRIKIGDFGLAATDFAPSNEALSIENTPLKQLADAADLTSGSSALPPTPFFLPRRLLTDFPHLSGIGTSLYIAPEVEMSGKIRGNAYDGKADLYSLGFILHFSSTPTSSSESKLT